MAEFNKSLDAATTNSTGTVISIPKSGEYNLGAWGTWDGATATWYISFNEVDGSATNGFTDANITFTADGGYNVRLAKGCKVWCALTNVGTTSVTAAISKNPVE